MANESVDVVTCDQAKHLVPTGAWVGKKKWKTFSCPMGSELLEGLICSCISIIRSVQHKLCMQVALQSHYNVALSTLQLYNDYCLVQF